MKNTRMTVSRDRLAEFKRNSAILDSGAPSSLLSTDAFFQRIEDIKWCIGKINENVSEMESLHTALLSSINGEKSHQFSKILDDLVNQTSKLNKELKDCIKETDVSIAKLPTSTSDRQMRRLQLDAVKKKFIETIQRYQDVEREFEKNHRQRIERQILIVKPEATPDEIELVINSDEATQIFAHSLLNSTRTGNASQVLDEVQIRHKDIKRIEKTIMELHNLFLDMQTMIELQQETLHDIEKTTESVVYDLEKGNKQVNVAVKRSRITRKKKWCCFFIFLIVLIVTTFLVWWFVFPKSHS
ncbi:t-SNARE [Helicostylum pulchrum]|nr:t-SNARE [Helicostylum pulchrum]